MHEPQHGSDRSCLHRFAAVAVVAVCALTAAACGSGDRSDTASRPKPVRLVAPSSLVAPGTLTFCSDIGYPPMEFHEGTRDVGADIEIGARLAKLMHAKVRFVDVPFDDVLDAVRDRRCDAAISAITDTPERRTSFHFVRYLEFGQSLMVQTANPRNIEDVEDLAGADVAVQAGTTNEEYLRALAPKLDSPPHVTAFQDDTAATAALAKGDVDAYIGDSPAVAYHIGQEALTYAFAGDPIDAQPIGIAVRPTDHDLRLQLARGIDAMYEDGSMRRILKRWKLDDFALHEG